MMYQLVSAINFLYRNLNNMPVYLNLELFMGQ